MSNRNKSDSETCPFHVVTLLTLSAGGAYAANLNPTTMASTRLAAEADNWAHFRMRSLKFRIFPQSATPAPPCSVGFVGGVQDTAPATLGTVGELLPSAFMSGAQSVPSDWVSVRKNELAGPLPWYKTIPGTADATEEAPGVIVAGGTANGLIYLEMRGVVEFKTSVAPANTPAEVAMRAKLRAERVARVKQAEKEKLLAVLSVTSSEK